MGKDYYGILGIKKDATEEDIKKSYKRMALRFHPDKNKSPRASEKFREVAEAYEVLISRRKRQLHDRCGEDSEIKGRTSTEKTKRFNSSFGDGKATFTQFFTSTNAFQKFFDFGTSASRLFSFHGDVGPERAEDPVDNCSSYPMRRGSLRGHSFNLRLGDEKSKSNDSINEHDLFVSLENILTGSTKKVKLSRVITLPNGNVKKEEKIFTINIQPGCKAGTKIMFQKQESHKKNQMRPDVVFVLRDKPHPDFKREGSNIKYTATVSLKQALCGCRVEVPTLKGDSVVLDMKEEILKPHHMKRLHGLGLPHPKEPNKWGDLIVSFDIKFPNSLPRYVKNVLEKTLPDPS